MGQRYYNDLRPDGRNRHSCHRNSELSRIVDYLHCDFQIRPFCSCDVARGGCRRRVYSGAVHVGAFRPGMVSWARGRGFRIRRGDLARAFADLDLLFSANTFSRRSVLPELSELATALSRESGGYRKTEDWEGIPPEKHFANVVAALGLGFLLATAVTQFSGGRRKTGLLGRTSQLLSQLTRCHTLLFARTL